MSKLPESIYQLSKLRILDVSENQLTTLPDSIGQLTNLQSFDTSKNQLITLPQSMGQLTNLQRLFLSENQLTKLPASVGQLTNLNSLNLTENQLTTLPKSIGKLTNLQSLYLSHNHLTALPESTGQLLNLISLNLYKCKLTSLPSSFHELKNLKELVLSNNDLTLLPERIGELNHLLYIEIRNNQLTILPESINQLPIHAKNLIGNPLTHLPQFLLDKQTEALKQLGLKENQYVLHQPGHVIELNLSGGSLEKIPEQLFYEFILIEKLDLSRTKFQYFPEGFQQATLKELDLSHCKKYNFYQNKLGSIFPNLKKLNLAYTQLSDTLPEEVLGLMQLEELNYEGLKVIPFLNWFDSYPKLKKLQLWKDQKEKIPLEFIKRQSLEFKAIKELEQEFDIRFYYQGSEYISDHNEHLTFKMVKGHVTSLNIDFNFDNVFYGHDHIHGEEHILSDSFIELHHLKVLSLIGTGLTQLPERMNELVSLEQLDVSHNSLLKLPESIGNLSNLKSLYISYNLDLRSFPESISQLTGLEDLGIAGLPIFPDFVQQHMTQLKSLDISSDPEDLDIDEIPDWIENMTELVSLDIKNNYLEFLPDFMKKLSKLRWLNLENSKSILQLVTNSHEIIQSLFVQGCRIEINDNDDYENNLKFDQLGRVVSLVSSNEEESIPNKIGELTQLESLEISSNYREFILGEIGPLIHLKELKLSEIQGIFKLPESLGQLTDLERLDLSDLENLSSLPNSIIHLTKLISLSLTGTGQLVLAEKQVNWLKELIINNNCKIYIRKHNFLDKGIEAHKVSTEEFIAYLKEKNYWKPEEDSV